MRHRGACVAGRRILVVALTFCLALLTPTGFGQQDTGRDAEFRADRASVLTRAIFAGYFQGGAAVPSSFIGCLLRDDGVYVVYDDTTRVAVEIRGNEQEFQREWGNRVQVVGITDSTAQSEVASLVVSVSSLSRVDQRDCTAVASAIGAQMPLGQLARQAAGVLSVVILEGDGAITDARQRAGSALIVQVRDENDQPVAGATVEFLLPEGGPGGTFPGGAQTLSVVTDSNGQAVARGFQPNGISGQYQIRVEASFQELSAQATISQTNAAAAADEGGPSGKLIAILAAIGGAAAVGGVLALRGSDQSPGQPGQPPSPTTITPGTSTVGGPP